MNTQQQPANGLPDSQTAYNNLFIGAHQQVFFAKCAAAGYQPRNAAEANWMLEIAGKLRLADQAAPVKAAADAQSPYFQLNQALDGVLRQFGLDTGIKQAEVENEDMALRQAALQLSSDPLLYNSVLSLKVAEAAQIQQEYQQAQQNGATQR